jgi:hypothetical protein
LVKKQREAREMENGDETTLPAASQQRKNIMLSKEIQKLTGEGKW